MRELHLHTPRLLLCALGEQHRELFCRLFTDVRTMRFIGPPMTYTRAARAFARILRRRTAERPEQLFCAILEKATGVAIGIGCLQQFDPARRSLELGLMLRSDRRACGFGHETVIALLNAGFQLFPVDEIWIEYDPEHTVAERLFTRAGFAPSARGGADDAGARMRLLSAHRHAWHRPTAGHQIGKD